MSDHWIIFIPEDPDFVPAEAQQLEAEALLQKIAPDADEVTCEATDGVQFFDCGSNFMSVACPACGTDLDMGFWGDWMDDDFKDDGFDLTKRKLPCCGHEGTLHQLTYDWPQGFGRFCVQAMNAGIGRPTDKHVKMFEDVLGCRVRAICQHL